MSVISDVILHNISTFGKVGNKKISTWIFHLKRSLVCFSSQRHRLLPWFFWYIYVRRLRSHLRFAWQEYQPIQKKSFLKDPSDVHISKHRSWYQSLDTTHKSEQLCVYLFGSIKSIEICKVMYLCFKVPWHCWSWSLVIFFWNHWRP